MVVVEMVCSSTLLQDMGGAVLTAAYQNHGGAAAESYTDFAIAILQKVLKVLTIGAAISNNTSWCKSMMLMKLLCMLHMQ
jgi:hypothetical protein